MSKIFGFLVSIIFYLVGVGGLFALILWSGGLLPTIPFDTPATMGVLPAVLKNITLVGLFGLQHTIMARQGFKKSWTKIIPAHLERSIYVLVSGLLCFLIIWQWAKIDGALWSLAAGSTGFYVMRGIYFFGILFLLSSSFLINHFELFGLQQGYFNMVGKKASPPTFKEIFYYKIVRHPIYLGFILILWATPHMSFSHLTLALFMTIYILIGSSYEEKDLGNEYGETYTNYKERVPGLIPFSKL